MCPALEKLDRENRIWKLLQPPGASPKDDSGRVHETSGISHAYPNRLNQRYQTALGLSPFNLRRARRVHTWCRSKLDGFPDRRLMHAANGQLRARLRPLPSDFIQSGPLKIIWSHNNSKFYARCKREEQWFCKRWDF